MTWGATASTLRSICSRSIMATSPFSHRGMVSILGMSASARNERNDVTFWRTAALLAAFVLVGCDGAHTKSGSAGTATPTQTRPLAAPAAAVAAAQPSASAAPVPSAPFKPLKVEVQDEAMGTSLHFIAYTT